MKQKTFLLSKAGRYLMLLTVLIMAIPNAWGASVSLSLSDFGWTNTTYSSKSITKTVGFTCNNGAKNGTSNMAFKKSASLWNTSAFSQNITSVVVNVVGFSSTSSAGFYIYGGTSAGATTTTIVDNSGSTGEITADFSAYSYKYFTITVKGSRAMYVSSIVINYGGSTKTFTLYLPKGDGTYDHTTTTTDASDLGDGDIPFSKKNCGSETLDGTFTYMWTNSAIARASASTADLSNISPKYDKNNPPSTSATLYPLFYDGVTGLLHTAPVCVVACTTTPTMSFTNATVNKELTGAGTHTQTVTITNKGSGQTVAYSSSNTAIGTVNSSGVVSLTGTVGSTTITASVERDGTYCANSATYTINVSRPKYTVTWSVNGNTSTISPTTNVTHGSTTTAPTASATGDCAGLVFRGWTTSTISGTQVSAPDPLFTGTTPAITNNVTFYAVFAEEDND